jgi:protein-tyrosine kinase
MENNKILISDLQHSNITNSFRKLRNNIQFANSNANIKSILITSSKNGEGKSTVASNLAIALAESGKKTMLLDFDFNHQNIPEFFDISSSNGLYKYLFEDLSIEEIYIPSGIENLHILCAGEYSIKFSSILASDKIKNFINDTIEKYDYVIIDSSSLLSSSDAQVLSKYVHGCILVVGEGEVDEKEVTKSVELLQKVDANILGSVFNKSEPLKSNKRHKNKRKLKKRNKKVKLEYTKIKESV